MMRTNLSVGMCHDQLGSQKAVSCHDDSGLTVLSLPAHHAAPELDQIDQFNAIPANLLMEMPWCACQCVETVPRPQNY